MAVTLGAFDELYRDRDHTVVTAPPLIVQVRRGPMTLASLNLIDRRIHEARARTVSPGAPVALVSVLEEGAPVVGEDVRAVQRRTISAMFDEVDVRIAVVVVGDGLMSTLQRTVARGVALTSRRVRIVKMPEEASAWIAPHLGVGAAEVRAVIDRARALR